MSEWHQIQKIMAPDPEKNVAPAVSNGSMANFTRQCSYSFKARWTKL